jgi:hypothetical protein
MSRNDKELAAKNMELAFEFSRLVLAKPELARKIPDNALVVFEVEGDAALTTYSKRTAKEIQEPKQPIVVVHVEGLAPSRLIHPELRPAANF